MATVPRPALASIPLELRLAIFDHFLYDHKLVRSNKQPSNAHISLLHTCTQFAYEAGQLAGYRKYISLRHERQITSFLKVMDQYDTSHITQIDVANDGRMVKDPQEANSQVVPVSELYLVLQNLKFLDTLRVFENHRARPLYDFHPGVRVIWAFEESLFPYQCRRELRSYEIHISPSTHIIALQNISSAKRQRLRLSGCLRLHTRKDIPNMRHLTITGVTGNFFDRIDAKPFGNSPLHTFEYAQGDRLGFEIRDRFLLSLLGDTSPHLRKLVLLGCNRLTSSALATCIQSTSRLEYFALSLITVDDWISSIIRSLPESLLVLKLKFRNALRRKITSLAADDLCASLESLFFRESPPLAVYLDLGGFIDDGRVEELKTTLVTSAVKLIFGRWEQYEHM
ncbi:hypothetical protein BDQ12DRAFT_733410 [Crucibulum laeve]|uniref:F-box domain-containing protein n=1 Tax=Crucibulum laeve TaxID=68775 RepID=A0A5C3MBA1_9AGAR|nr:hypothetical protein BDQ12DRAFT_733410 [Crucibulum laeve]